MPSSGLFGQKLFGKVFCHNKCTQESQWMVNTTQKCDTHLSLGSFWIVTETAIPFLGSFKLRELSGSVDAFWCTSYIIHPWGANSPAGKSATKTVCGILFPPRWGRLYWCYSMGLPSDYSTYRGTWGNLLQGVPKLTFIPFILQRVNPGTHTCWGSTAWKAQTKHLQCVSMSDNRSLPQQSRRSEKTPAGCHFVQVLGLRVAFLVPCCSYKRI